jgi:hypothetical protein
MSRRSVCTGFALILTSLIVAPAAHAQTAPGGPGANAVWTDADKDGYGTSRTTASRVWHTLDDGALTEVYYPDLGTPSVRTLDFVISDGSTFAERDSEAARRSVRLVDRRSLTYRQVNVHPGRYRITKTYVTDPRRNTLLVRVRLDSLTGRALQAYAVYDPSLGNDGMDDSGTSRTHALLASDSGAQRQRRADGQDGADGASRRTACHARARLRPRHAVRAADRSGDAAPRLQARGRGVRARLARLPLPPEEGAAGRGPHHLQRFGDDARRP